LSPFEESHLLEKGYGITNLVNRATARARDLARKELEKGAVRLVAKVKQFKPRISAVLGLDAFRKAFGRREETIGEQSEKICATRIWVLPNPSGLNAHYQLRDLILLFEGLRTAAEEEGRAQE
jgi:double-stranded uracil-DNA glycosylase